MSSISSLGHLTRERIILLRICPSNVQFERDRRMKDTAGTIVTDDTTGTDHAVDEIDVNLTKNWKPLIGGLLIMYRLRLLGLMSLFRAKSVPKGAQGKRSEKPGEPGKPSNFVPPVQKTADEMLDEEIRKSNAQSSTFEQEAQDLDQPFIDAFYATGSELIQQSGMAESHETFESKDPLTPFLAYVLFLLHYRNNLFPDSWMIFKHTEMREIRDRKRATVAYCKPWSSISNSDVDGVCLELLGLFQEAPPPLSMNNGIFRTFAKALISAKLKVGNHFKPTAKSYHMASCNSKLYLFEVQSFPGPEPVGQTSLAWAHCSDIPGSCGILAAGRVIRTAAYTLGLRDDQESMSFFGRCHTNPSWTENFIEWAANLNWSTKNSSGIVFGGFLSGQFIKSPSANTILENSMCRLHPAVHSISKDKRWAIRESAARIDFIIVVADQDSADFPAPAMLPMIADRISQRSIQDTEAWGGWAG
ncbi:unnamed protein product [Symbiodinium sp. CCMP2592]|nr:unnamed protein product [Symbiodinium sp. CCMP2592]